jgi:hypothetical protein
MVNQIMENEHMNNTELKLDASKEFVDLLFEKLDCFIEFRFIKGSDVVQRFYRGTRKVDWREIRDKNAAGFNVFYGVCGRQRESGKKQDVSVVPAFWVDIDSKSRVDAETVLRYFKTFTPNEIFFPSYTIASGHGAHAYWFLEQPLIVTDDETRANVEGYIRGLARLFQGDRVQDLSRVMRLPETINWKNANEPALCVLASCDNISFDHQTEARRFELRDFERFYHESVSNAGVTRLTFDNDTPMPDLSRLSAGIRYLITKPPAKGQRSSAAYIVIQAMKNSGYTPSEVKAVFMNNPIGDRYAE